MTIITAKNLTISQLDWAIGFLEKKDVSVCPRGYCWVKHRKWSPSVNDRCAGKVLDKRMVDTMYVGDGEKDHAWVAVAVGCSIKVGGKTRLEAAMRCLAQNRLPDGISIPDDVLARLSLREEFREKKGLNK